MQASPNKQTNLQTSITGLTLQVLQRHTALCCNLQYSLVFALVLVRILRFVGEGSGCWCCGSSFSLLIIPHHQAIYI